MKLNNYSKQYLKHFKYLKSIKAESITSSYVYSPNVLKQLKYKKEKVSKNLKKFLKHKNAKIQYLNIKNDHPVLSLNTSLKNLDNSSFMLEFNINENTPAVFTIAYNKAQIFLGAKNALKLSTAQFCLGDQYYVGSVHIELEKDMYFGSTHDNPEHKDTIDFFRNLHKEYSEDEMFQWSTIIKDPHLFYEVYKKVQGIKQMIKENKKMYQLLQFLTGENLIVQRP